ncbi:DUF2867 domain-containing protein [Saxibacter everestensis]|uniref:DUF2867 domain-containing protein n=1 Tax=Saxibacter everestensis TaxID=2909229 RepID=A0ABY8QZU6_9MICO|nr:DUF2867 domain-containing protein [Brevibacteriaceae bacterium ZFBP1038]
MQPTFYSQAFDDIPAPDFADVTLIPLPAGASEDPAVWARTIFGVRTMPPWVLVALGLRQGMVRLLGIPKSPHDVFDVARVAGEEALIVADDEHLDFRCAVGVDAELRLVRVTTTVRFHGWRGRAYFAPVRLAHPVVVGSMLRRASRILAG